MRVNIEIVDKCIFFISTNRVKVNFFHFLTIVPNR